MKRESIRTTVDIPVLVHRKLKAQAAAQGCSVRELVLRGIRVALVEKTNPRAKKVRLPIIKSKGHKIELTNEQLYELIELP